MTDKEYKQLINNFDRAVEDYKEVCAKVIDLIDGGLNNIKSLKDAQIEISKFNDSFDNFKKLCRK